MQNNPLAALIILDGYALRDEEFGNAVKQAHTPNFESLLEAVSDDNTQVLPGKRLAYRKGRWETRKSAI